MKTPTDKKPEPGRSPQVHRVQTGARMEKRLVKVLKALAEYHDLSLGDLLEGIVLHAFEGKSAFGETSLRKIRLLKEIYGLDLDASMSHKLVEVRETTPVQTKDQASGKEDGHAK